MTYFLFGLGFVLLVKGADWLVAGASAIGRKFQVQEMTIGLTIVSFGTSLPELLVTTMASLEGKSELGVGNILGSNISNILVILGLAALIRPLPIARDTYLIDIPISMFAVMLLGFLANSHFITSSSALEITRIDGLILLFFFFCFMVYMISEARAKPAGEDTQSSTGQMPVAAGKILAGIVMLYFGGEWVVNGASLIASRAGLSESFIGLTIVALGTSLPELVTSAVAAYKGKVSIAVGNAIGSNIFNVLWILGFTAVITPIPFSPSSNLDIMMVLFASASLIVAVIIGKYPRISRAEGMVFILVYAAYVAYLVKTSGL